MKKKKEIDFLNLINNYNFSDGLDGLDINEGKKFIKEFKIKYENLELLLESFVYDEYLSSLFMNCNIYSLIINNLLFYVNEESKKRLEEYIDDEERFWENAR